MLTCQMKPQCSRLPRIAHTPVPTPASPACVASAMPCSCVVGHTRWGGGGGGGGGGGRGAKGPTTFDARALTTTRPCSDQGGGKGHQDDMHDGPQMGGGRGGGRVGSCAHPAATRPRRRAPQICAEGRAAPSPWAEVPLLQRPPSLSHVLVDPVLDAHVPDHLLCRRVAWLSPSPAQILAPKSAPTCRLSSVWGQIC